MLNSQNGAAPELVASSVGAGNLLGERSVFESAATKRLNSYAIATSGQFTDNGNSNFAGDLNNPFDDARLYAGGGLTINGLPTVSGFGAAIAVGPEAVVPEHVRARWKVENLAVPVAIELPKYELPALTGTERVIGAGGLVLGDGEDLRGVTIVVEQGDVNLNGAGHELENVRLIVKNGAVNLGDVRAVNTSVYASGGVRMNQGARFSGRNLLVTQSGDVIFNGQADSKALANSLKVISHGNIYFNAPVDVHADFLASGSLIVNYDSNIVGSIQTQGGITFNAKVNVSQEVQPLIGIIDTGFSASNPDINYNRIISGRDLIDNDNDPFLPLGTGNEHGTHILGLIGATQSNGIGINGINDKAPVWLGRAVGSGRWAESLIEFVDTAKQSGQPRAIALLSFDLTQVDANGRVKTRYDLTPQERQALDYARQHGVLIIVPAGNNSGVSSVLGQASQEFPNLITVGSLATPDSTLPAAYSNRGRGLNLVAYGGDLSHQLLSTLGDRTGSMFGTSVAAAEVAGVASRVWAMNPTLNPLQIKEILLNSAIDLGNPGWDTLTGSGKVNLESAIALSQRTTEQSYEPKPYLIPTTWSGAGKVTPRERAANLDEQADDTLAGAQDIGLNPVFSVVGDLKVPISIASIGDIFADERDFCKFSLDTPKTVNITLTEIKLSDLNNSFLSLDLQDINGKSLTYVQGQILPSGVYYIEVRLHTIGLGEKTATYTLKVESSSSDDSSGGPSLIPPPAENPGNSTSGFIINAGFVNTYWLYRSQLGAVIGNMTVVNNTKIQRFTNGSIIATNQGVYAVYGKIWQDYQRQSGIVGDLGLPTSNVQSDAGTTWQTFEKGTLFERMGTTFQLDPKINEKFQEIGGSQGSLGVPVELPRNDSTGFIRQEFEKGYIVWNGQNTTAYFTKNSDNLEFDPIEIKVPTIEFETHLPIEEKIISSVVPFPSGRYLVEGKQENSIVGKVKKINDEDASVGNEDIFKLKTLLENVSIKFDRDRNPSIEIDGKVGELSLAINGSFFTGLLKADASFPIVKRDFFEDKGSLEMSVKTEFDGRYYRELSGSPLQKIAEYIQILIFSKENQEVAHKVMLEKNPDVQSWLTNTIKNLGYVAGAAALTAVVVIAVAAILDDATGIGFANDPIALSIISGLIKFALQQFGVTT